MPNVDELLKRLKIAGKDTDPFEAIIKDAKEYDDAIKHGDKEKLKKFDFSVSPAVSCLDPYSPTSERLLIIGFFVSFVGAMLLSVCVAPSHVWIS